MPQSGTDYRIGMPIAGLVYTANLYVRKSKFVSVPGKTLHNWTQVREAGNMQLEMEQTLCRAATGRPCPV